MLTAAREGRDERRRPGSVQSLAEYRGRPSREEFTAFVGMVVFLASWAMLFASLFFSYGLVRAHAPVWPPLGEPQLPIALPAVNTAVILVSSAVLQRALGSFRSGHGANGARALGVAALLGAVFLALQIAVWVNLYRAGLQPSSGPYGSVFYALTCFHGLHVLVGLVALGWLTTRAFAGAYGPGRNVPVRLWTMYWHFVGAVWLVLFATVYLI